MDSDLPTGTFKLTDESPHFDLIVTFAASWAMLLFCKDTINLHTSYSVVLHTINVMCNTYIAICKMKQKNWMRLSCIQTSLVFIVDSHL